MSPLFYGEKILVEIIIIIQYSFWQHAFWNVVILKKLPIKILSQRFFEKPYLVFLILAVIVNLDAFRGSLRWIPVGDVFDSWFVYMKIFSRSLSFLSLPAWNPDMLSGVPALLNGIHPFNPFALIAGMLPLWLVYSIWTIIAIFIAAYGMFCFLNKVIKLDTFSTYFASCVYAIFIIPFNLELVFVYSFPLYLYLFNQICTAIEFRFRIKYVIILALLFLTAPVQFTIPYIPILHLILIPLAEKRQNWFHRLIIFSFIWVGYCLIHVPNIYQYLSELGYSNRADYVSEWHAISPMLMSLKYLAVKLRGFRSAFPILLSLSILSFFSLKNRAVLWAWTSLIISVLIAILSNTAFWNTHAGIFSSFQWDRLYELSHVFFFSLLAGFGFAYLKNGIFQNKNKEVPFSKWLFPAALFGVLLGLSLLLYRDAWWLHPEIRRLKTLFFYQGFTVLFIFVIFLKYFDQLPVRKIFYGLCLSYILVSTLFFTKKEFEIVRNESFNFYFHNAAIKKISDEKSTLFRSAMTLCRFSGRKMCFVPTALNYHGLQTIDGYVAIFPRRYKKLWINLIDKRNKKCAKWAEEYMNQKGNRVYIPLCSDTKMNFNFELLALMNVKYLFSSEKLQPPPHTKKVKMIFSPHDNLQNQYVVYQFTDTLPRNFMVSDWTVMKNENDVLEAIATSSIEQHRKRLILLESDINDIILPDKKTDLDWNSHITAYEPNTIRISGHTSDRSILFLSDLFHNSWKAYINGTPATVFPANYIFRGVVVPKGDFVLEFKYQDQNLNLAYALCMAGLLFILLLLPILGKHRI